MSGPDDAAMLDRIRAEVQAVGPFVNWHGITAENLSKHLVEPYRIVVNFSGWPTTMWVVVHEYPDPRKGYLVAYHPADKEWCLVERLGEEYVCDIAGDESLAEALSNM